MIYILGHPLRRITEALAIFSYSHTGSSHTVILPIVLGKYVIYRPFNYRLEGFLEDRGHTEFPFQHIAHEHEQILREALKLEQIICYIVYFAAARLYARVYFTEERIGKPVDFFQHLSALCLFAESESVVHCCHVESLLENSQIGKH